MSKVRGLKYLITKASSSLNMLIISTPKTSSYLFLSKLPRIQLCSRKLHKDVSTVLCQPNKERVTILVINAKVHSRPKVLWKHTSSSVYSSDRVMNYFWNVIIITNIKKYTSKINKYNYGQSSKKVVEK